MKEKQVELFLDSGAFSAWRSGQTIDIEEYIQFLQEHQSDISVYANLDVIGDAKATWENQKKMENAGLHPIPTYHYGEDPRWLRRYLYHGYDYIALGGMVPIGTMALGRWLDSLFGQYLCDEKGFPKVKVHAFGMTSLLLMLRYPWYSVDSTSWVISGRMGSVYIPRYYNGQWIYDKDSWKIAVSNRSPSMKEAGKHFTTLTEKEREIVLHYITSKGYRFGQSAFHQESQKYTLKENERWFDKKPKDPSMKRTVEEILIAGVSNTYQLRDELNIIYFLDLEKSIPEWPWAFRRDNMAGALL